MAPEPTKPLPKHLQAVTIGPFDDDWAVVDDQGDVLYIGHAIYAARILASLSCER